MLTIFFWVAALCFAVWWVVIFILSSTYEDFIWLQQIKLASTWVIMASLLLVTLMAPRFCVKSRYSGRRYFQSVALILFLANCSIASGMQMEDDDDQSAGISSGAAVAGAACLQFCGRFWPSWVTDVKFSTQKKSGKSQRTLIASRSKQICSSCSCSSFTDHKTVVYGGIKTPKSDPTLVDELFEKVMKHTRSPCNLIDDRTEDQVKYHSEYACSTERSLASDLPTRDCHSLEELEDKIEDLQEQLDFDRASAAKRKRKEMTTEMKRNCNPQSSLQSGAFYHYLY